MRKVAVLLLAIALSLLMGCGVATDNAAASSTTTRTQTPASTQSSRGGGCAGTGDIQKCTTTLPQAPQNASPPRVESTQTSGYGYTVKEYVDWVVQSADEMWTKWFLANGFNEPYVWIEMIFAGDPPVQSRCVDPDTGKPAVTADDTPNAFYCAVDVVITPEKVRYDGALILPITALQQVWLGDIYGKKSDTPGDFGAAMIVAHEFGHHVQDELSRQDGYKPPTGKNKELIADCFAGNWATSVYKKGELEKGDMLEAANMLGVLGDVSVSTNSHGTAEERIAAMMVGYMGSQGKNPGDPRECFARYWH